MEYATFNNNLALGKEEQTVDLRFDDKGRPIHSISMKASNTGKVRKSDYDGTVS